MGAGGLGDKAESIFVFLGLAGVGVNPWGRGAATAPRHRQSSESRGSLSQVGHRPTPPHKHMGALPLPSEPRPQIHP